MNDVKIQQTNSSKYLGVTNWQ